MSQPTSQLSSEAWRTDWLWIAGAAALGLATSACFAGALRVSRPLVVVAYAGLWSPFLIAYFGGTGVEVRRAVRRNLVWGLLGAAVAGVIVVNQVVSQPPSPAPHGARLALELLWLGLVYGALDALLLTVMPVVAVWQGMSAVGLTRSFEGTLLAGATALAASLLVTAAYHFGYPEFRGPQLLGPLIGNAVLTVAFLVTRNPIAAIAPHVAMHMAAVLHGAASSVQLPPHY